MKHKLLKSALLGAAALGVVAGAAKADISNAKIYVEVFGTGTNDQLITVPCEATDYLAKDGVEYNLDPNVPSPMGNLTGAIIKYVPTNSIDMDKIIAFTLKNAVFGNNLTKCWLVFYEHNGIDTNGDGVGDTDFDVNRDGDAGDRIIIAETQNNVQLQQTIELNAGDAGRGIPSNAVYYLWCQESGEDSLLDKNGTDASPVTADNDKSYAPVIKITEDLYDPNTTNSCTPPTGTEKVCIAASGYQCCPAGSGLLDGYTTIEDACFIDTACQFALNMRSSISIIDMYTSLNNATCDNSKSGIFKCYDTTYEPGTAFVPVGGNDDILDTSNCTDRYAADGNIIIINDNDDRVDDDIRLGRNGWTGKFSVSIYDIDNNYACDNDEGYGLRRGPYTALDFANGRMYIDNNGKESGTGADGPNIPLIPGKACTATAEVLNVTGCTSDNDTICLDNDSTWIDDVYMGVNKNRLYWVRWGMTEELKIYSPDNDLAYTVTINEEQAAACDTRDCCYDGDQKAFFKKWEPNGDEAYVPYMLNNNEFRVIVSNNSCWDAEIYARVWDSQGRVADNVYLGKVRANSVTILAGNVIFTKARQENPEIGVKASPLYSMILTVGGPKRDIEFAAYDNRANRTKMIPVYDLSSDGLYYRNIDFKLDPFEK